MTTTPHDTFNPGPSDLPYDISSFASDPTYTLTDAAYDVVIDDIPFIANISNQNPYRRETAQYKKDQFDNSQEPGEQSFTGWWLRSQTSFHNGSGINFYEPGVDYEHVSHRFKDSRGVDVWTVGEATLLNEVFHSYTGANGIVSVAGRNASAGEDCIIAADSAGNLKVLTLNQNAVADIDDRTSVLDADHSGEPFKSITSDGTRYFAVCSSSIHAGNIDGTNIIGSVKDISIARHDTGGVHVIKYTKGYLMFGEAWKLYYIPLANPLVDIGHDGSANFPATSTYKVHENPSFAWNVIEGGSTKIYAAGYAGSDSEIWAVPFDPDNLVPDPTSAVQVLQLPYGEIVKSMYYYLGYLAVGSNKGIRICQVQDDGSLIMGPLLYESDYDITGFVANDKYIWASTTVDSGTYTHACLVRINLSLPFADGAFPYAYDLEYRSSVNTANEDPLTWVAASSIGLGVHYADDRLHLITNEGSLAGEIQTEKLGVKRDTGWIETGKIRYGTIEPKFFRYINLQCATGAGDSIVVQTRDENGSLASLVTVSVGLSNQDLLISNPSEKQETMAFRFVFNNVESDTDLPILRGYQIKSTPAIRRQRLIQYPLSCYDTEMDRFSSVFGYSGRAIEIVNRLEAIEETGKFVTVRDYRANNVGEEFSAVIEEVRFINESSPDKDSSGFGGILIITLRKM